MNILEIPTENDLKLLGDYLSPYKKDSDVYENIPEPWYQPFVSFYGKKLGYREQINYGQILKLEPVNFLKAIEVYKEKPALIYGFHLPTYEDIKNAYGDKFVELLGEYEKGFELFNNLRMACNHSIANDVFVLPMEKVKGLKGWKFSGKTKSTPSVLFQHDVFGRVFDNAVLGRFEEHYDITEIINIGCDSKVSYGSMMNKLRLAQDKN